MIVQYRVTLVFHHQIGKIMNRILFQRNFLKKNEQQRRSTDAHDHILLKQIR